ncbi:MAG: hypothetical protein ACI843_001429 [Psychrobacter glaciei]|jgi:hypothetical protein
MRKQQGAGAIPLLAMLILAIMGLVLIMKVVPFYSDDMSVETVFENLAEEATSGNMTRGRVEEMIAKRFGINGIDELVEFVEVTGQGSDIAIEMVYERRAGFFSNIELVATFEHYVDIQ